MAKLTCGRPAWISLDSIFGMPTSRVTTVGDLVRAGAEALGDAGEVLGPLLAAVWRPVGEGGAWRP